MLCNNCKHDIPLSMGFSYAKGACPFCGADFLSDARGLVIQKFYNELFTCFGDKLDMDRLFIILDFIYSPGSELIIEALKGYRDTFNEISAAAVATTGETTKSPSSPLPTKMKSPKKISRRTEDIPPEGVENKSVLSKSRPTDYTIPEAELLDLPDDLKDFARNVKTKADNDMFLKMLAESMVNSQGE